MQMDRKQKVLMVLTVAAFGFLGYQVFALVKQDVSEPAVPSTVVSSKTNPTSVPAHAAMPVSTSAPISPKPAPMMPSATPLHSAVLKQQTQGEMAKRQHSYLNLVNQLELAKMKRQLLQEQLAIAQAQNNIAKLHHETTKITGGQLPQNTGNMAGGSQQPYQLSYVDRQNGQWSATLNFSGDYEQVQQGTQLPDGFTVMSIDGQGVTLQQHNQRRRLTFNGIVNLPAVLPKAPGLAEKAEVTPTKAVAMPTPAVKLPSAVKAAPTKKEKMVAKPVAVKKAVDVKTVPKVKIIKAVATKVVEKPPIIVTAKKGITPDWMVGAAHVRQQPIATIHNKGVGIMHSSMNNILDTKPIYPNTKLPKKVVVAVAPTAQEKAESMAKPTSAVMKKSQHKIDQVTKTKLPVSKPLASSEKKTHHVMASAKQKGMKEKAAHEKVAHEKVAHEKVAHEKVAHEKVAHEKVTREKVTHKGVNSHQALLIPQPKRILALPGDNYTIQLIGSYHMNIVHDFVQRNHLNSSAILYTLNIHKKQWNALIYGSYHSLSAARKALHNMPAKMKDQAPWIRRIRYIQKQIQSARS